MTTTSNGKSRKYESVDPDDTVSLYYRDVRPIPLLTREEEVELSKRIDRGEEAKRRLEEDAGGLSTEERARLEAQVRDGQRALDELIESNFRLVISIAKRYAGDGVPLLDLTQEGNMGLIRAAEKFDHRKGNKFSTYATWWIRQAVVRAQADQGSVIRIPVHMKGRIRRLKRIARRLEKELGRWPTAEEIAEETDLSLDQVELALGAGTQPLSLEMPVGDQGDKNQVGDFIEDEELPDPSEEVDLSLLSEDINELLLTLSPREARVLTLRYGLGDGREYTLKEVGERFDLTRERIRQIEKEALRKLRHPRRRRQLRAYLN